VTHGTPTTTVKIENTRYAFRTNKETGKVGLLMVGFGGNNGSTILGGIIANREGLEWNTKKGMQKANMYGSMTQCSSMKVADSENGEVYLRIN
jgi:myo-inositol-1-phosphate synthase